MAADFFDEIEPTMRNAKIAALCRELSNLYRECGEYLEIAIAKEADASFQKAALTEWRELDLRCDALKREILPEIIGGALWPASGTGTNGSRLTHERGMG